MTLEDLGYSKQLDDYQKEEGLENFHVGRVVQEHKERYLVKTDGDEFEAELIGNLRFTAESRDDFAAVGDWVAISPYDESKALIHRVFPRHSVLHRQAVGRTSHKQIIATNIDYALIVQSMNRDFSINRLERYLTICNAAGVHPIIILSKTDLLDESEKEVLLLQVSDRIKDTPIVSVTNQQEDGYASLKGYIKPGKTYCLLGSSGVGKSTLLNHLAGEELMDTREISTSIDRGKHVTTHRELVILEGGGVIIDNPGMREVGIADTSNALEMTFDEIMELAKNCKYKDCSHLHEEGCAILEALENKELNQESYDNYLKMYKERMHFETSREEKKRKEKGFGKMIKQVKKIRKQNKY